MGVLLNRDIWLTIINDICLGCLGKQALIITNNV